jgi:hypothetical protein
MDFTRMDHGMGWDGMEEGGAPRMGGSMLVDGCGAAGMKEIYEASSVVWPSCMLAASCVPHLSLSSLAPLGVRMTRTRLEGLRVSPPVLYDS